MDNIGFSNIHVIGTPEQREANGTEKLLEEIMAENIPIWWHVKYYTYKMLKENESE